MQNFGKKKLNAASAPKRQTKSQISIKYQSSQVHSYNEATDTFIAKEHVIAATLAETKNKTVDSNTHSRPENNLNYMKNSSQSERAAEQKISSRLK